METVIHQSSSGSRALRAILASLGATIAMTLVVMIATKIGMPKISPPGMLAMMTGLPMAAGWAMHFMIGMVYSLVYAFLLAGVLGKINSKLLRGLVFGLIIFVFAQIMMAIMGMAHNAQGSMMLRVLGVMIAHITFGITLVQLFKEPTVDSSDEH